MTLLTCARKHHALLWRRYNRALVRRHALASRKKAMTSAAVALAASASATGSTRTISNSSSSNQSITATASAIKKGILYSTSASIPINKPLARSPTDSDFVTAATESTSPWRALFLAFFAMIQPEKLSEPLEVENDFMNDLRVNPVPSHVSDSVACGELIWRYDMDSYAANNHNEDRSQYILDTIKAPTPEADDCSLFFCGCYDGHGGEEAVEYVQRNLYRNIKQHVVNGEAVADAIVQGFQETDQAFHRRSLMKFEKGAWSACSVGACAVIAIVVGKKLYIASCGDCRAIMAFREPDGTLSVEQITWDHSANDEREQERLRILYPDDYDIVREIGADNFYVKGRLQPTRSLGDTYMKVQEVNRAPMPRGLRIRGSFKRPYITAVPDVFEFDLDDRTPEFLVLGSDGLYGEMTNDEIAHAVDNLRQKGVENVSESLRSEVLDRIAQYYGFSRDELEQISPGERRNYHDDITIDVVHFTPPSAVSEPAAQVA